LLLAKAAWICSNHCEPGPSDALHQLHRDASSQLNTGAGKTLCSDSDKAIAEIKSGADLPYHSADQDLL